MYFAFLICSSARIEASLLGAISAIVDFLEPVFFWKLFGRGEAPEEHEKGQAELGMQIQVMGEPND